MSNNLRRIQKIKGGSFIVSLPSNWIRENGLDVTREVEVFESSGIIKVRPKEDFKTERVIELTSAETAQYLISVYYMQGVSRIRVESKDVISKETKDRIKILQMNYPGLNLKNETFNALNFEIDEEILPVARSFLDFSDRVLSILEDIQKVVETPRDVMKQDIVSRCNALNIDYYKLIRSISLTVQRDDKFRLDVPVKDIILYSVASRDLGRFITHTKLFVNYINVEDAGLLKQVEALISIMKDIMDIFRTEDISKATDIRKRAHEILDQIKKPSESCKELDRMVGYTLALMDDAVHKAVHL